MHTDIANLQAAARASGATQLFMTAASPGVISFFVPNWHYPSRDEYLAALVEAMRPEYRAIVDAGLTLQLVNDVELADIVDLAQRMVPAGISLEACNPRHGHEWQVFEDVALPEGRYLIPGVVDSTTNFVEHPELVAQRLSNYARVVGPERVMAGTDCGFGTFTGVGRVAPSVVWAKLATMAEGAHRAAARLKATSSGL